MNENLLKERKRVSKLPKELAEQAQSYNHESMSTAKREFFLKFEQFRSLKKEKIVQLEMLIENSFKMFENAITNLSKQAEDVVGNIQLDSNSLKQAENNLYRMYKPLLGIRTRENEHFYTIRQDWHDTRQEKNDCELDRKARKN